MVKIRFLSPIRDILRFPDNEVDLDIRKEVRLTELISLLKRKYGKRFSNLLCDEEIGDLRHGIIVIVNERVVQRIDEEIKPDDEIVFTLPIGGG